MKKSSILIPVLLLIVLSLGGLYIYQAFLRPEALHARVQHALEERFHQKVIIKDFTIDLLHRPRVTLEHIELGSPEEYYMKADGVAARFSPLYLLIGRVKIRSITLKHPTFIVNLEKIKPQEKPLDIPRVRTGDGHATLLYKGRAIAVDNIRGSISNSTISLDADMLGGTAGITALKIGDTWRGKAQCRHLGLEHLTAKLHGVSDLALTFTSDAKSADVSLAWTAERLDFAWGGHIRQAKLACAVQGTLDFLAFQKITFTSSALNAVGTARLLHFKDGGEAVLDLDLQSGEFDYNAVTACLPTRHFPAWLDDLLVRQIRGGRSQFRVLRYRGRVYELTRWDTCLRNLQVALTLNGQSFSVSDTRRITGVTGVAIAERGTIELRGLSGTMGTSRIKAVTVKFPDVVSRGLRLAITVDLDMRAEDFIAAWRAAIPTPDVRQLLDPVHTVTSGRVRGAAKVFYDNVTPAALIHGEVYLSGCSLAWNKVAIRNLSGTATARDYGDPVHMRLACTWDDTLVDAFTATLSDPLGEQYFSYVLKARGLPTSPAFALDKDVALRLNGTAKWPEVEGDLTISSRTISLFDQRFQSKTGPITGRGILRAQLYPVTTLDIPDLAVALNPAVLHCQIGLSGDQARYKVVGKVPITALQPEAKADLALQGGSVSGVLTIAADKQIRMGGALDVRSARLRYKDKPVTINGLVRFDGDRIRSSSLTIKQDETTAELTGVLTLGDAPFLSGEIALDGLKIGPGGKGDLDFLWKYPAKVRVTATNLSYYGIPITYGSAQAEADKKGLRLVNMDLSGPPGTIQGSSLINPDGSLTYDLNLALRDTSIVEFIQALTPSASPGMDGNMDLTGHVWGNQDAANGDVVFKSRKGRIHRYNLFSRIFSVLNPYKMIKSGEIDLLHNGFPYNTISATFTIRDSVMSCDDFYLDSNSLQVSAVGKYFLKTNYIDCIMGVEPLETFDKTISQIPVVGWILTGDKGTLIVVSLRVRGQIDDPSVQHLPSNTISKPVADSLLRILKLPVDILTKPGDVILPGILKKRNGRPRSP